MKTRYNFAHINPARIIHNTSGGITIAGVVLNAGVLRYNTSSGGLVKEAVLPEHLQNPETIKTIVGVAVTNEHPDAMISVDNYRKENIGTVLNPRIENGTELVCDIAINDAKTINEIMTGKKRELSAGYYTSTVQTGGRYNDDEYDCIQTAIKFNHVAIVKRGRGGSDVSLRLNSKDDQIDQERQNMIKEEDGKFVVYSADGSEKLGEHSTREEAEAQLAAIEAEKSGTEESVANEEHVVVVKEEEESVEEVEEVSQLSAFMSEHSLDDAKVIELLKAAMSKENSVETIDITGEVKETVKLLVSARELGVKVGFDLSREQIQTEIIKATKPHLNVEGKSGDYKAALLDDVISTVDLNKFFEKPVQEVKVNEQKRNSLYSNITPVEYNNLSAVDMARMLRNQNKK